MRPLEELELIEDVAKAMFAAEQLPEGLETWSVTLKWFAQSDTTRTEWRAIAEVAFDTIMARVLV